MGEIHSILEGGIILNTKKKEWILQNLEEVLKHTSSILVIPAEGYFENPAFVIIEYGEDESVEFPWLVSWYEDSTDNLVEYLPFKIHDVYLMIKENLNRGNFDDVVFFSRKLRREIHDRE